MPEHECEVVKLSPTRMLTIDLLHGFSRKPIVHGLIEADLTVPLRCLREIEARKGETLSFSAFLIHCLATAVTVNGHLNVVRSGRHLYRFDEVKVGTMVEREQRGEKTVAPLRIGSADRKSVREIHDEVRHAQTMPICKGRDDRFAPIAGPTGRPLQRASNTSGTAVSRGMAKASIAKHTPKMSAPKLQTPETAPGSHRPELTAVPTRRFSAQARWLWPGF